MEEKGKVAGAPMDSETYGPFTKDNEEDADMGMGFDQSKPYRPHRRTFPGTRSNWWEVGAFGLSRGWTAGDRSLTSSRANPFLELELKVHWGAMWSPSPARSTRTYSVAPTCIEQRSRELAIPPCRQQMRRDKHPNHRTKKSWNCRLGADFTLSFCRIFCPSLLTCRIFFLWKIVFSHWNFLPRVAWDIRTRRFTFEKRSGPPLWKPVRPS